MYSKTPKHSGTKNQSKESVLGPDIPRTSRRISQQTSGIKKFSRKTKQFGADIRDLKGAEVHDPREFQKNFGLKGFRLIFRVLVSTQESGSVGVQALQLHVLPPDASLIHISRKRGDLRRGWAGDFNF